MAPKDFRQHGDNIQAAIHLDDQDFALFTSGINDLVLTFTDNEGEATNMCMVHIDPMGKVFQLRGNECSCSLCPICLCTWLG